MFIGYHLSRHLMANSDSINKLITSVSDA